MARAARVHERVRRLARLRAEPTPSRPPPVPSRGLKPLVKTWPLHRPNGSVDVAGT